MGSTLWADPAGLNNLMGSSCVLGPVFDFTVPGVLPPGATFSRASKATLFDGTGTLQEVANDVPAWTYDPSTLALQGAYDEELRTNGIRNSRGEGAVLGVVGSGGAMPPNWAAQLPSGLIATVTDVAAVEDGLTGIKVRISGTPTGTGPLIRFEAPSIILASNGQAWANALNARLVGGNFNNVTVMALQTAMYTSGGAFINTLSDTIIITTAALRTQRFVQSRTLNQATTGFVTSFLQWGITISQAIDFTLFLADPQLEQGTGASSIILPPVGAPAAATRAVVVVQLALANGTYNIDIYRASGLTSLTNVVVTGNSYTVPTDLSPLRLVIPKRIA